MGGAQAGGDCVLKLPFGPRNANSGPRRSPLSLPKISLSDDFRVFRVDDDFAGLPQNNDMAYADLPGLMKSNIEMRHTKKMFVGEARRKVIRHGPAVLPGTRSSGMAI